MKVGNFILISITVAGLLQPTAGVAGKVIPLSHPEGEWVLSKAFSDEFNENNISNIWNSNIPSWSKYWVWSKDNIVINNGYLNIVMKYSEHTLGSSRAHYSSGIIRTKSKILYGYFEARIKAANRFPGVAPAFWASPVIKDKSTWTELDFVELTQHEGKLHELDMNTHVFRYPVRIAKHYPYREKRPWVAPWDPRKGFHVYGCKWGKKKIIWYIDGVKVAERPNTYWHQPLNVSLSLGLRPPLKKNPSARGFPTVMRVDYVRVWRRIDK